MIMKKFLFIVCTLVLFGSGCSDELVSGVPPTGSATAKSEVIIPGSATGKSASAFQGGTAFDEGSTIFMPAELVSQGEGATTGQ
jgi:hypothetical protein